MVNYEKIDHQKIWEYLKKLAPFLQSQDIENLETIFHLMKEDYTPIQKFNDATLQFEFQKEEKPYVNPDLPDYMIEKNYDPIIEKMLTSYNEAKSHMEISELICIAYILSMMDDYHASISLVEKEEKIILKLSSRDDKNIIPHM